MGRTVVTGFIGLNLLWGLACLPLEAIENKSDSSSRERRFLESIYARISRFLGYPEKAKQENWEGVVKVRFTVKKNGNIEGLEVERSSGYLLLDRTALEAVEKASPYPFPFTNRDDIDVSLPIRFGTVSAPVQYPAGIEETSPYPPDSSQYARVLLETISDRLIYPEEAKDKARAGTAKVAFIVRGDGSIEDLELIESSGVVALDEAVLQAVEESSPFVFPFKDIDRISVVLPITFDLSPSRPKTEDLPTPSSPADYARSLLEKISPHLVYPEEAEDKALEGEVKVGFLVNTEGGLGALSIKNSSGHPLLDRAALEAVERASPYPPYLNMYGQEEEIAVTIPLRFTRPEKKEIIKKTPVFDEEGLTLTKEAETITRREAYGPVADTLPSPAVTPPKPRLGLVNIPDDERLYSEAFPSELKEFINTAIINNQPLQVAREEMILAEMKIKEAYRNLFPAFKVQGYSSTGDVNKLDFEEREIRFNVEQPIYHGGGLWGAYDQTKTNLEITKRNYDQRILDIIQRTEISYHTLITLKMNLQKQNEIVEEAAKIVKVTEGQYKKGLIIPLEFNKVQSWQKRLELTKDSIAQELEMAYLSFQQTLNTRDIPKVSLFSLDMREFDITLERCVEVALTTRPEINLANLWVDYYRHNKRIEDSKNAFNVDFTGSYGYYQGHFDIEPWTSSSNWFLGFRVTKPWGANTATSSLSLEESQPRFGETSPTGRQTLSGEFGVLDNLAYLADKKGAEVALFQAESQLDETEKNITFEVQDAYLKYQKSFFEVKSALTQRDYRKEELKITRANVLSGVQSYSSLIETLVNLSEAENTYLRALGNYYISLAGLRKATGYGLSI